MNAKGEEMQGHRMLREVGEEDRVKKEEAREKRRCANWGLSSFSEVRMVALGGRRVF